MQEIALERPNLNSLHSHSDIAIGDYRAELLTDTAGIYGLAFHGCDALDGQPNYLRSQHILVRPDRLVEHDGTQGRIRPILQPLPRLRFLPHSAEHLIADQLLTAMLARVGLERHGRCADQGWWSDEPANQAANRRRFHAYKRSALAITNGLVRAALTAAQPDALTLARRFPPHSRYSIYRACTRSRRFLQLAEAFPFLAYRIAAQNSHSAKEAMWLINSGVKLRTVAGLMQVPMALRKVKPGAVGAARNLLDRDHKIENLCELIHAALPEDTAGQRRWLGALSWASALGGPYVEWVARNSHQLGNTNETTIAQVADVRDWVRACYIIGIPRHVQRAFRPSGPLDVGEQHVTRPFSPDMSVATVRDLCGQWHEAVALSDPKTTVPLPSPWRGHDTIDALNITPLDTVAAIAAEGRAMHHCAAVLIDKIREGDCYLFSAREGETRIATIEVGRAGENSVSIVQMRGSCNTILPKPLQACLMRWARQKDKWRLPSREIPRASPWDVAAPCDDDLIPF